jgi:hypothetical protein
MDGGLAMRTGLVFAAAGLVVLAGCMPVALPPSGGGGCTITSFGFLAPPVQGTITEEARTIELQVPAGTDPSALVAAFVSTGARVTVAGLDQESGRTANDFSRPVEYVVEDQDGSRVSYVVHVTVQPALGEGKAITGFSFVKPPVSGTIDESAHTISLVVPHGTDRTSLAGVFTTTGVLVTVDDTVQTSGETINDFSEPLTYVVAAENGSTAAYLVEVQEEPSAEKRFTSFSIQCPGAASLIDEAQRIVHARVAEGTELSSLVAVFTTTGVCVKVAGRQQESGITANDFASPVDYEVFAEDGSSVVYTVLVAGRIGLLINELDVDQVGIDNAEFIELFAVARVDLFGVVVILVNGGVTPGQEYARIDLSTLGSLSQGSYLVVAGPMVPVFPPGVKLSPPGWGSSNRIQNGPSDAVILWDSVGRRVIDTVTYAGVLHRALIVGESVELDPTEGSTGAPADSNSLPGSIGRSPNGVDTGQNGADFKFIGTLTPGTANP